jgi:hypothetical protein
VSSSRERSASATHRQDRDNDNDNNDDDQGTLAFGHLPDAREGREITKLVRGYFAAAATEDGRRACALLTPIIAESVVERDGHSAALRGNTCSVVMSKLFKVHHRELTPKQATFRIMRVGIVGYRSLVALDFPSIPEVREITARRVGSRWTVLSLLDEIIE